MKLLAFYGAKQAGKSTLAKYLIYNARDFFGEGSIVARFGFADPLKEICRRVFGIPFDQLYGDDRAKGQLTSCRWPESGKPMTIRDLLQYVGTDVCRAIDPDCWVKCCINSTLSSRVDVAVIDDGRFENEVEGIHAAGGKAVLLKRRPIIDTHASENSLPGPTKFDAVLPDAPLEEVQSCLFSYLKDWGWLCKPSSLSALELKLPIPTAPSAISTIALDLSSAPLKFIVSNPN